MREPALHKTRNAASGLPYIVMHRHAPGGESVFDISEVWRQPSRS